MEDSYAHVVFKAAAATSGKVTQEDLRPGDKSGGANQHRRF
jgi:hypothetical protein